MARTHPRAAMLLFGVLAAGSVISVPDVVFAAAPEISYLFPAGGQRGTKVTVTCTGKFAWPVAVHAPGVLVAVGKDSGKLDVTIPTDLAADRVWFRFYNSEGASAAVPFLIGGVPEVEEKEPNNAVRNAQVVSAGGTIVNGVLMDNDVDAFAVPLEAGQTLVAALDANTMLGSPMDAILQVVSPDGIVAAENHDDVDLDPRLAFRVAKSGIHVVRVFAFPSTPGQRIAFHGGADYIYRLTITNGPYVTHAVPLAVAAKEPGMAELRGWNIPEGSKFPVQPFGGKLLGESQEFDPVAEFRNTHDVRLGFSFAMNAAGGARIRLSPYATVPGIISPDEKNPLALSMPTVVSGWLRAPRQADHFKIPLKKGEQLVVTVETRSLYFPLDPKLKLVDPTGATAAEFDDASPTRVSALAHTAAHDGDYRLIVTDRYRRGGDRCYYRLTARLEVGDFELTAASDSLVVGSDKPTEFVVQVQRRAAPGSLVGPITVGAIGLPPGISVPPVISEPTGPSAEKVTLKFSSTGMPGNAPIRILGRTTQPQTLDRFARTPVRLGNCQETVWLTGINKPAAPPAK